MPHFTNPYRKIFFCLLLCTGSFFTVQAFSQDSSQQSVQAQIDALKQQVEELNNVAVRTQSHMMVDVEYQFANLWFAAHNAQWDLASFYLRESRSHLAWTVRVRPVRNVRGGGTIDLKPFQDSIDAAGFTPIQAALDAHDVGDFESKYSQTLSICHSCHEASGLGYLEPRIPQAPLSPLMLHKM